MRPNATHFQMQYCRSSLYDAAAGYAMQMVNHTTSNLILIVHRMFLLFDFCMLPLRRVW